MNKIRTNKLLIMLSILLIGLVLLVGSYVVQELYTSYKIKQDTTVTDKNGNVIEPLESEIEHFGD